MTIAVQVKGKLRDTLTVAKGLPNAELEALALASEKVQRSLDGARGAQGDRGARPAGQHRRMKRLGSLSRCSRCARRLRPAADVCRRRQRRGGAGPRRGRGRRRSRAQAGWLVRNALRRPAGAARRRARAALSPRRAARRQARGPGPAHRRDHRPRAAHAARALPAGRPRRAARSWSTPPPAPTPGSTWSAREYATIAAEQTALENLAARSRRPDRHPARAGAARLRREAAR